MSQRPLDVIGIAFPVPMHLSGKLQYYVGIDPGTLAQVRFQLFERTALERQDRSVRIVTFCLLAAIATLALYNLFVFLSVRDVSYLYYALFAMTGGLVIAVSTSLDQLYLWPDTGGPFLMRSWAAAGAHMVFASFFAIRFLSLHTKFPVLAALLHIPAFLSLAFVLLALVGYPAPAFNLVQLCALIQHPLLVIASFRAWRAGQHAALYYIGAWILYVLSANYMILAANGHVIMMFPSSLSLAFGMAAEDLVLSMALAARINGLRLEKTQLTAELSRSYAGLEVKIAERTVELVEVQQELMSAAREAGKAEIASGVLHNIGNALNSVVTRHAVVVDSIKHFRLAGLEKFADLMSKGRDDLSADAVGQKTGEYLHLLVSHQRRENEVRLENLGQLGSAVQHICRIVEAHQEYAMICGTTERISISQCIDNALEICGASRSWADGELLCDYEVDPEIIVDPHRLCEIIVNLIKNSREACDGVRDRCGRVTLRTEARGPDRVRISVSDNGVGIAPDRIETIFHYGQTTKTAGHGFGLHSAANTVSDLGGRIGVFSDGEDRGATFWIELPHATA